MSSPGGSVINELTQQLTDQGGMPSPPNAPQWGLYLNGAPVILADNVVELDYDKEWRIADYQVEGGAFESYDKVERPFTARVRFSRGGSDSDRQAFLNSIDAIAFVTTIYSLVMPDHAPYPSVTVSREAFSRRADSGAGLLSVDLTVTEVRQNAQVAFTNTQSPASANPVGGGNVQGGNASQTEQVTFTSKVQNLNNVSGGNWILNGHGAGFNGGSGW